MQFKHPELLWALLLLLIPIIVHLLQLRRFKKTPFTNVAMLQRVVSESRKSQQLKKWLLLMTRLLLLAGLVLAFAQPFSSKADALTARETVIYLDNSFSMTGKKQGMSVLNKAVQDLIQVIPKTATFSLFTNNRTYTNVTIKQIQNELLSIEKTTEQLDLDQVLLKANSLLSDSVQTIKNVLLISDLQQRTPPDNTLFKALRLHVVNQKPDNTNNVYIDSLSLGKSENDQISLTIEVTGLKEGQTLPLSVYDNDRLIAKTAVKGSTKKVTSTLISLPKNEAIKGKVYIEDPVLEYDNHFFFSIDKRNPPKVLAISEENSNFLKRLYVDDEFDYINVNLNSLDYSLLSKQNTIILNGLQGIPSSLSRLLLDFSKDGGTIVVIPAMNTLDITSYNSFLQPLLPLSFEEYIELDKEISNISFQHPLYNDVFEKEVSNFDYPNVKSFYKFNSKLPQALSYTSFEPFLSTYNNSYVFSASLAKENSNFINSPLIVPTFYNIAERSLSNPTLYQTIGKNTNIDITIEGIGQDNIIKLASTENEFIPLQKAFSNKVRLQFEENPKKEGIYAVLKQNDTLQNISFNYKRDESKLDYLEVDKLSNAQIFENTPDVFKEFQEETSVTDYWKWFVIFALLFALIELLIQKWLP